MSAPNKTIYAAALFERLHVGVIVPLEQITFPLEDGSEWGAAMNECHQNATDLSEVFPGELEAVRGWLVFDYRPAWPRVEFMHHSVVREISTGRLFDPTPQQRLNDDYRFIEAREEEGDYVVLIESLEGGEKLVHTLGA